MTYSSLVEFGSNETMDPLFRRSEKRDISRVHPCGRCHQIGKPGSYLILFLIVFFFTVASSEAGPDGSKVSFLPQWLPQAQFAGYMVARDKGFYREQGLDVTIMRGGPGEPPMDALNSGKADFCTSWLSTAIQRRAAGDPIVNIGQIIQRSALMLISKRNGTIHAPMDFEGKKVGIWEGDFRIQPLAFFRMHKLNVQIVPLYGTINLFFKNGVDAISGMYYNEYHTLLNSGLDPDELNLFPFRDDSALDFPEDGIYCREETFRENPAVCAKFVAASLKGWLYVFRHPDEALDIVMKYAQEANTGTNRAHQRWMLQRMKNLIMPGGYEKRLGKLAPEDYLRVGNVLQELNFIRNIPSFDEFYRGER
jgi:NitT/TauT family transport system substrate-binding protein